MGKTTVNEAKRKGAEHTSTYSRKQRTPAVETAEHVAVGGGSIATTLKRVEDEQKSSFYQEVFEEVVPAFNEVLDATSTELEIDSLLHQLEERQAFHEKAAVLRQRKQALITAKTTCLRHLETTNPDFAKREEAVRRLDNLMEARKRFLGGVAIPQWAPGSPELEMLKELDRRIAEAKAAAISLLDTCIDTVQTEMTEGGYDEHLTTQDALWKAFHEAHPNK